MPKTTITPPQNNNTITDEPNTEFDNNPYQDDNQYYNDQPFYNGNPYDDNNPYYDTNPYYDINPYYDANPYYDINPYTDYNPYIDNPYYDKPKDSKYDDNNKILNEQFKDKDFWDILTNPGNDLLKEKFEKKAPPIDNIEVIKDIGDVQNIDTNEDTDITDINKSGTNKIEEENEYMQSKMDKLEMMKDYLLLQLAELNSYFRENSDSPEDINIYNEKIHSISGQYNVLMKAYIKFQETDYMDKGLELPENIRELCPWESSMEAEIERIKALKAEKSGDVDDIDAMDNESKVKSSEESKEDRLLANYISSLLGLSQNEKIKITGRDDNGLAIFSLKKDGKTYYGRYNKFDDSEKVYIRKDNDNYEEYIFDKNSKLKELTVKKGDKTEHTINYENGVHFKEITQDFADGSKKINTETSYKDGTVIKSEMNLNPDFQQGDSPTKQDITTDTQTVTQASSSYINPKGEKTGEHTMEITRKGKQDKDKPKVQVQEQKPTSRSNLRRIKH